MPFRSAETARRHWSDGLKLRGGVRRCPGSSCRVPSFSARCRRPTSYAIGLSHRTRQTSPAVPRKQRTRGLCSEVALLCLIGHTAPLTRFPPESPSATPGRSTLIRDAQHHRIGALFDLEASLALPARTPTLAQPRATIRRGNGCFQEAARLAATTDMGAHSSRSFI